VSKNSSGPASNHRQAVRAELKKAEQRSRRLRLGLLIGIPIVIVAVVATLVVTLAIPSVLSRKGGTPSAQLQIIPAAPAGATTTQSTVRSVPDHSGITGVLAWDTKGWPGDGSPHAGALDHNHVDGPVTYSIFPPVGGPHSSTWMNAGAYSKPIPSERAVHNLEHGAVWITYNPNLPSADIAALAAFVARQSLIAEPQASVGIANDANRYIDLSPWASSTLPAPIVMSAWGHQLRVTSASDPRLQQFVDTFRNNRKYSPEFGSGVDGIPVETGGRAATSGAQQANPPGQAQAQ